MKITLLPFRNINALTDLNTNDIYISSNTIQYAQDNLNHELCHLISQDPDHNSDFRTIARELNIVVPDDDIFSKIRKRLGIPKYIAANVGSVANTQGMLLDYHLLQAYRRFSSQILGTYGMWEVINEVNGESNKQLIRLYPTPKGAFPVVVLYIPVVNYFRSPQARIIVYNRMVAEAKVALGMSRRKITGMPTPDGGSISYDGSDLISEGTEEINKSIEEAINLGEPMPILIL